MIDSDIVMIGYAGLEGSAVIAEKKQDILKKRYPSFFVSEAIAGKNRLTEIKERILALPQLSEAAAAGESGESGLYELGQAGVFMGLWNMAQTAGVGLEVILSQIPIRQETVEICNFFDINPYVLLSGGSWLLLCRSGSRTVQMLAGENIPAAVIGITTSENDRVIRYDGEKRFLEKKYEDSLLQIQ